MVNRQLELATPSIDSTAPCRNCDRQVLWDEIYG
jgi:hypothetical protein